MPEKSARFAIVAAAILSGAAFVVAVARATEPPPKFMPLLATGKTVVDEQIVYPTGAPAKLTTAIVAMLPGAESGWHTHGVPVTGLILQGELTVDYGEKGKRTYKEGESIAEAINVPHNSKNTGTGIMRLFVVYIGAEGLPTTIPIKK